MGMFANLPDVPKEPKSRGYQGMFANLPDVPTAKPGKRTDFTFTEKAAEVGKSLLRMPQHLAGAVGKIIHTIADYDVQNDTFASPGIRTIDKVWNRIQPEWHKQLEDANRNLGRKYGDQIAKYWTEAARTGFEAPSKELIESKWTEAPFTKALVAAGESSGSWLIAIIAGYLTKNPQLGIAILSAQSGVEARYRQIKKGSSQRMANAVGFLTGAWEGVTEQIPFHFIFNTKTKGLLKKFLIGAIPEGLQEFVQGIGENFLEYYGYNYKDPKSIPSSAIEGLKHTLDDWQANISSGFIFGGGTKMILPSAPEPDVAESFMGEGTPPIKPTPERAALLKRVYMKGFTARLTSIKYNADNIIAGAGEKSSQLRIIKEELSRIKNHYESIAKDIKENPELLAELGQIDKLLPDYSQAINDFVSSPSKKGFKKIKVVGDKIAKLSTDYGIKIGEQAPQVPEGKPTKEQLAVGHKVPEVLGMTEEERKAMMKETTGKTSMADMTPSLAEEYINALREFAKEKGLTKEDFREFREPTILHFLRPQLRQAQKLGVKFMTRPSEIGKQSLDIEFKHHVKNINRMEKIINRLGGETIKSKAAAILKGKPTKSVERFTELLNENETAPADLSIEEKTIFNYFRNLSRSIWIRENQVREKLGMKPIPYKSAYVRHIIDRLAEDIDDGRHPVPEELKYWAQKKVKTKIRNPMELQRQLGDELEDIFSKDLIKLSKAMMWTGLREVHLSEPLKFFEDQMGLHSEVIPAATREWTEKFINHMIKGQPTRLDESLDALVTKTGINGLCNKLLKPFGRITSDRPLTNLMQKAGRLQIYGVMGWRPKQLLRNKFQLTQNLALYTLKANLKSFLPASKQLKEMISNSLFFEGYKGFEDLNTIDRRTLGRYWLAPFRWTATSNARQAMKCAYWDTLDLIENPKYREFGWADPKRTYKEESEFLYDSEKEAILYEMEYGAGATQYHYIPMAMPEVFRHKALIPFTRLQSWWMNYFFNFHEEAATRFFTGKTGYGQLKGDVGYEKRLPWSRRIGWGRYMVIGGIILNTLGYTRSYLLGAAPDSFPPIGKLLANMFIWLKAMWTGKTKARQSAERKIYNAIKTFIPGYLAIKDVRAVAGGKKGPVHLLFYGKGEKSTRGQRRKRPTRRTR